MKIAGDAATKKQLSAEALYNQQLNLNQLYDEAISFRKKFEAKHQENEYLKNNLEVAFQSIANMSKAIGMLLHDKEHCIKHLTKKQEMALKAIQNYGIKHVENAGFDEIAQNMRKYYGFTKGIQDVINELMPKPPQRGKGGYEL